MKSKKQMVAIIILFWTGILGLWIQHDLTPVRENTPISVPFIRAGWEGSPYDLRGYVDEASGPYMARQYRFRGGAPLQLLILRYDGYGHIPPVCYQGVGWRLSEEDHLISLSGRYRMTGLTGKNNFGEMIFIFYGIHVRDRMIKDGILRKVEEIRQRFNRTGAGQYLVEITMVYQKGQEQETKAYMKKFMDDIGDAIRINQ